MRSLIFLAAIVLCLTACSASKEKQPPVLPLPEQPAFNDPDNMLFMDAVAEFIQSREAPGNSRYEFTRLDLNHDGRRDGLILMKSPHKYWCGANGCDMYIFMAANDHFELVSEIAPVRGPIIISNKKTNGWNDIIVHVSGRSHGETKDVSLQFTGATYPGQPAFQSEIPGGYKGGGIKIFP